jgi:hypothetical protein
MIEPAPITRKKQSSIDLMKKLISPVFNPLFNHFS